MVFYNDSVHTWMANIKIIIKWWDGKCLLKKLKGMN